MNSADLARSGNNHGVCLTTVASDEAMPQLFPHFAFVDPRNHGTLNAVFAVGFTMTRLVPVRLFFSFFVPAAGAALAISMISAQHFPVWAPTILLAGGMLAFVAAVRTAAQPPVRRRPGEDRKATVLGLLEIRRNRCRYAFVFAVGAASMVEVAVQAMVAVGLEMPVASQGRGFMAAVGLLYLAAWCQIGCVACSHAALRRVLVSR